MIQTDKAMKKIFLLLIAGLLSFSTAYSQLTMVVLDNDVNGQTMAFDSTNAVGILDNGGNGRYTPGDHYITITSTCSPYRFSLLIGELDIDCRDTLYIYDGPSITSPVRAKINNCTGHRQGQEIFASPSNTSGVLTVRFHAVAASAGGTGFVLSAGCGTPCEKVEPVIESKFYRTRNGVVYDSAYLRNVPVYDTSWNISIGGDTLGILSIDTEYFIGAHLCVGDGVIFKGHGEYSYEHGYYTPSDATTMFTWDMANDGDILSGLGMTEISYNDYQTTGCYDMSLTLTDAFGCISQTYASVKIRTSVNPIKTIFTLADICNRDSLMVNMGYSGENATLTLREVESNISVSKINEVRTFIPDGPNCPPGYYEAPVVFTEFPASKRITNAGDVCSICINMEHSFMGDVTVSIICPTGNQAFLFYGNQDPDPRDGNESGGAGYGGSGTNLGYALDDGTSDNGCDSLNNPFGGGLDYCFSRNGDYTLVTGERADAVVGRPTRTGANNCYITGSNFKDSYSNVVVGPEPTYFNVYGGTTRTLSGTTKHPSDHLNKLDYYIPYTDFSELVGCPLNGTWKIRVHDKWGVDNGWVFNWSMDICGVTQDDDCKYVVGLDSLVWRPDPAPQYHDYDLGYYRGLVVNQATPKVSYISSPDTAGTFPINVYVYDEFGCIWDTNTRITTFWTPEPNLGNDTTLCGVNQTNLDATDRHTATQSYSYIWEPYGQNTPIVETAYEPNSDIDYVVEVTNNQRYGKKCITRDTIHVSLRRQPLPNFEPSPFTFEGCDPMTLTFQNHSVDAISHFWDFGDGITSELESPTHTFATGTYTLKYYATSADGCVDSVVSKDAIAVYPTPTAAFSWTPVYPSVLNPVVVLNNNTVPDDAGMRYFWEIQYDRDNPLSFETLLTHDATYDFSVYNGSDVSGNYGVRLISRSDNLAPSGNMIHCADTASNSILVINDFLQFPNVVTPNGDGINDRFVIQNLVDGLGYPINTLDIYNKWGTRVYHKENISSDSDFWDPADLPDGTYFYRFSAKGYNGNIEHNGAVEVLH